MNLICESQTHGPDSQESERQGRRDNKLGHGYMGRKACYKHTHSPDLDYKAASQGAVGVSYRKRSWDTIEVCYYEADALGGGRYGPPHTHR